MAFVETALPVPVSSPYRRPVPGSARRLLSIVIPTWNGGRQLSATLGHLRDFRRRLEFPAEIIIVDDCSEHSTARIARDFADDNELTVVLRNESGGPEINLVTDAHGAFTFSSLGAGTYRVEFLLAGLKRATIKHLELQPSVVTHVRVTMKVEAMESITVGGAGPDPLAQTSISTTFTQSFIDKLPH